jgi:hypothetical protein
LYFTESGARHLPNRVRDRYLRDIFEALIRYAHEEREIRLSSEQDDGALIVHLRLADNDAFQMKLSEVMSEPDGHANEDTVAPDSSRSHGGQ